MPFPLLPVLGGLLGGASIWSESSNAQAMANVSRENTDKQIAANKEMANYAYARDLEMWNRANAYNSPAAQMDRLRQAGLNPMLLYGTGSSAATGNTGTTMPKYQAPNLEYKYQAAAPNIAGVLGSYQNLAMMQAQVDNVKAQTNATMQKTANDALTNVILAADAEYASPLRAAELRRSRGEAQSAEVGGSFAQRVAELGLKRGHSQYEVERVGAKYAEQLKRQEVKSGQLGISRSGFELGMARGRGPYQLAVAQYEAAKSKADASLAAGALDVQRAGLRKMGYETKNISLQNIYDEFRNELSKSGLTPHDPAYYRLLNRDSKGFDPAKGFDNFRRDVEGLQQMFDKRGRDYRRGIESEGIWKSRKRVNLEVGSRR